jgi:hypothetical protein
VEAAVKRRDAVVSIAISGAGLALGACRGAPPAAGELTDGELQAWVRQVDGYTLRPGEAQAILASFKGNRFTAEVDPAIQPQSDFDADVE